MVGLRADDPPEQFLIVEQFGQFRRSSPTSPDQFTFIASLMIGCGRIARRPLDGVDLRHHRRVDQLGLAKQLVVGPVRMLVREQIADVVVLEREERVQHGEADPPVVGEAAKWSPVSGSTGSRPVGSMRSLPALCVRSFATMSSPQP